MEKHGGGKCAFVVKFVKPF